MNPRHTSEEFKQSKKQEWSEHPSFWTHQTQIFPKGIQMPHSLQCKLFPSWHAQGIWATPCLSKICLLGTLALFPKKPWRAVDCASPYPDKGKTALHSPHCRLQGCTMTLWISEVTTWQLLTFQWWGEEGGYKQPFLLQIHFKRKCHSCILWRAWADRWTGNHEEEQLILVLPHG